MSHVLKYELQWFEELLIHQLQSTDCAPEIILSEIGSGVTLTKQNLINQVFRLSDECHLGRYIRYHQQACIRLLDVMHNSFGFGEQNPERHLIVKECVSALEEILNYIESYFAKYFDLDAKAPERYMRTIRAQLGERLVELESTLIEREAAVSLVAVMLHPLKKFVAAFSYFDTTYKKAIYVKVLTQEMTTILQLGHRGEALDESLRMLLLYVNCNSAVCLKYFTTYIHALLDHAETYTRRVHELSLLLKKVNQVQVKPNMIYNSSAGSVKAQLQHFLTEELEYHHNHSSLFTPKHETEGFRMKFDFSVEQLACLIKILVDVKVISNSNLSELFRFFSRFSMTKKTEMVAYESLRQKYYKIDQGTLDSVRAVLKKMIVMSKRE